MKVYDTLFRRGLTRLDAEKAHHAAFRAIRSAAPMLARTPHRARRPVQAMGLRFPNRLGLAAGFDKSAIGIDALAALGFGHVEIGTVTARPQPGNPRPRLFRLPEDDAILNRMGFNNDGAQAVADRLAARMGRLRSGSTPLPVLGVNIGKSKVVPEEDEQAVLDDYGTSTSLLARFADYLVVNVSSPNTPGLRNLQAVDRLGPLLQHVATVSERVVTDRSVPLLVKIAPDLADEDAEQVADLALELGLAGIIATNTTISRAGLRTPAAEVEALGAGGISGAPVAARSLEMLRLLRARVGDRLTLISVGGISDGAQAAERIRAGASLVQAYSGFIYGGPRWPARLLDGLEHADTTQEDAR